MGSSTSIPDTTESCPLPPPLDGDIWQIVVKQLELAPQQERIVRLVMQSKSDKEIGRELRLRYATVRTYLSRVFARAEVEDRIQLLNRIYAIAIAAWGNRCPQTRCQRDRCQR